MANQICNIQKESVKNGQAHRKAYWQEIKEAKTGIDIIEINIHYFGDYAPTRIEYGNDLFANDPRWTEAYDMLNNPDSYPPNPHKHLWI